MTTNHESSSYEFKAEVKQLLDILAHSLYTSREIFLRELISNSSDALDKLRFEMNRGSEMDNPGLPLEIKITADKDLKKLTVFDTGLGMTKDEVIENIGTIAKSGSTEFLKAVAQEKVSLENIIGKFGVGFYSVFMVAKEVIIITKSYLKGEPPVEWRSDGSGTYKIKYLSRDIPRGTQIEVHLKDDATEFTSKERLKDIIKKHSNFISFPILVEDERTNTVPALWREPKFSIKPEQYTEFYKFLTYDTDEPLETIHVSVDAPVQFNSLLFIPKKNYDLLGFQRERPGLDLYVRRVLIQRGNKSLIPEYLGFVRGVVDSEDLPLNIARESIQENILLEKISTNLTKQILTALQKMAKDDQDKYLAFWREHGKFFKLGYSDYGNRDKYADLLRFNSSRCSDASGLVSLDEYINRAKPGQKEIYHLFGQSREAITLSPHVEIFRAKDLEVLYLLEPVDEFALDSVRTYKAWEIKSVEHADPKVLEQFPSAAGEDKPAPLPAEQEKEFEKFLNRLKDLLGERITQVRVSARLSESPCCLVSPDDHLTSSMQKIMQIVSKNTAIPAKVLEINKDHIIIRNLFTIFQANPQDDYLATVVEQLYESALLLDGYLKDPHAMVSRIQKLLQKSSDWYLTVTQKR